VTRPIRVLGKQWKVTATVGGHEIWHCPSRFRVGRYQGEGESDVPAQVVGVEGCVYSVRVTEPDNPTQREVAFGHAQKHWAEWHEGMAVEQLSRQQRRHPS
jgi:hypothetical protein